MAHKIHSESAERELHEVSRSENTLGPRGSYQVTFTCIVEGYVSMEIDAADVDAATKIARVALDNVKLDVCDDVKVVNALSGNTVVAANHIKTRERPKAVFDLNGLTLQCCVPPDYNDPQKRMPAGIPNSKHTSDQVDGQMTTLKQIRATRAHSEALSCALKALCEKDIVESDWKEKAQLKIGAPKAFTLMISHSTNVVEAYVLCQVLYNLLLENKLLEEASGVAASFYLSIFRDGRLANIPWALPKIIPQLQPDPNLEKAVLQRLIILEQEGTI
jgi:hypothetical protein